MDSRYNHSYKQKWLALKKKTERNDVGRNIGTIGIDEIKQQLDSATAQLHEMEFAAVSTLSIYNQVANDLEQYRDVGVLSFSSLPKVQTNASLHEILQATSSALLSMMDRVAMFGEAYQDLHNEPRSDPDKISELLASGSRLTRASALLRKPDNKIEFDALNPSGIKSGRSGYDLRCTLL
jgi:hypothetical protein